METQASKSTHPLLLIAGIAVILFCAAGVAAIMGWIPTTIGGAGASASKPDKIAEAPAAPARPAQARPAQAKPHQAPVQVANNAPAKAKCAECGVIESVREIEKAGQATGLGAVGGAVVGGVVGNQVGGGRGRDVMTVVGAVGGAVAGNQIEKKVKSTKSYEITIRLEDGSVRTVNEANPPAWKAGDKVRLINGQIQPNA